MKIPLIPVNKKNLSETRKALIDEENFQKKLKKIKEQAKESENARRNNSEKYYLKDCRGD